jgi:leucyl-tRNA synthetase
MLLFKKLSSSPEMIWCSIEHNGLGQRKVAYTLAQWGILLKEEESGKLMMMVSKLEFLARMQPLLWLGPSEQMH